MFQLPYKEHKRMLPFHFVTKADRGINNIKLEGTKGVIRITQRPKK